MSRRLPWFAVLFLVVSPGSGEPALGDEPQAQADVSDVNGDGVADGTDISGFLTAMVAG